MSKLMRGPWLYRGKSDSVHMPPADPVYQYGSQLFRFNEEDVPSDADLDLVLAAPDLLEALDACLGTMEVCFPDAPIDSVIGKNIIAARAALQKATGEPQ